MVTVQNVQTALRGLPNYSTPGLDGFTTDFFKAFALINPPSTEAERAEGDPLVASI